METSYYLVKKLLSNKTEGLDGERGTVKKNDEREKEL